MNSIIKILVLFGLVCSSCSDGQINSKDQNAEQANVADSSVMNFEVRSTEDEALDALDKIQINGWNLVSTFKYLSHDCAGPIGTFKISKEEFEAALLDILNQHYDNFSAEEKAYLASASAAPKDEYFVTTCGSTEESIGMEETIPPPRKGMWIFKAFLDQRDLILKW